MPFLAFLSEAVLVSLSGVMSPGPITAVAVGEREPIAPCWGSGGGRAWLGGVAADGGGLSWNRPRPRPPRPDRSHRARGGHRSVGHGDWHVAQHPSGASGLDERRTLSLGGRDPGEPRKPVLFRLVGDGRSGPHLAIRRLRGFGGSWRWRCRTGFATSCGTTSSRRCPTREGNSLAGDSRRPSMR